jgi:hypothetical protein
VGTTKPKAALPKGGNMRKQHSAILVAISLMAALTMPVFAQHATLITINVPFDFVAENQRMRAGRYTIQPIPDGRLLIRSADGEFATTVLSLPAQLQTSAAESQVVFHRYGGDYFLAQLWMQGEETSREVLKGRKEAELAKKGVAPQLASLTAH